MFTVPIVATDLRHEETIIQAVQAMEQLDYTIRKLFDKIDNRIEKNNIKIKDIKTRINVAERKINSLFDVKKAIRIFSSAKFPASHVLGNIPCTFKEADLQDAQEVMSDYRITSSPDPICYKNIQEKLMFYHVRDCKLRDRFSVTEKIEDWEDSPSNISFINSLFLYGNEHNIYDKRKIIDTTKKESSKIKAKSENDPIEQKIGAAPHSMSHRKVYEKKPNEGYSYTPKLNVAPEINVPIDLPDLPGIADDIVFEVMEEVKIAPSLYIENLPELPEAPLEDAEEKGLTEQIDGAGNKAKTLQIIPPPPPPPPPISSPTNLVAADKNIISSSSNAPPPPPPPIPPPLPDVNTLQFRKQDRKLAPTTSGAAEEIIRKDTTLTKATSSRATDIKAVPDVRSNLMEAIRMAGGTRGGRLRAASDVAKHNESNVNDLKSTGDLMADLHMKLSMRRKGISGTKQAEANQSTGSVVDRLSALIPPPPVKQVYSSATDASDEDDWAD